MTDVASSPFADLSTLAAGAADLGVPLNAGQLAAFRTYGERLLATNERMNLTAITDPEQVQILHFLDALSLVPAIEAWCKANNVVRPTVLDVGSGAGVPGIPLKIALPDLRLTLLDATGKRVSFLQETLTALGLRGIGAVQGRAEELGRDAEWREQFDLVTARALARLPTLLEWCLPFASVGGLVLAPKAGDLTEELEQGQRAAAMLGGNIGAVVPVAASFLPGRVIVPIAKTGRTLPRYPRGGGLPAKQPLGTVESD